MKLDINLKLEETRNYQCYHCENDKKLTYIEEYDRNVCSDCMDEYFKCVVCDSWTHEEHEQDDETNVYGGRYCVGCAGTH